MTNLNLIPQEIQDKANAMITKGSVMTFEAICKMFMKDAEKLAKKNSSKKEAAKWLSRTNVENTIVTGNASVWLAEKNRENAMKNLPSSLK